MKNIFFLFLLSCSALAAGPDPTVKTLSGFCGEDSALRGSGYAFSYQGAVFVVTSEHVMLHDRGVAGTYCHQVQWSSGQKSEAQLVAADWGTGLALLRLANISATGLPEMKSITSASLASLNDGAEISLAGYPYRSNSLFRDARGSILRLNSERHLLPAVTQVMEIVGGHGEFGMSGGPVFERSSGHFIGLLSHQILHLNEGGDTRVESPEQDDGRNYNHLLAIPVDAIEAWLVRAIQPKFAATFVRSPEAQMARTNVVMSAGLAFSEEAPLLKRVTVFRAGGEDGAGIGGLPTAEGSVVIRVNTAAASDLSTEWFLPSREALRDDLTSFSLRRAEVRIPYLLSRANGGLTKIYFGSSAAFFQLIKDPALSVPLLVEGGTLGNLPARVAKIREAGATLALKLDRLGSGQSQKAKLLLQRLRLLQELSAGENWAFLTKEDLRSVTDTNGEFREGWRELFSTSFDLSVETLRTLNSLECLIGYTC